MTAFESYAIHVPGVPRPQGSKSGSVRNGRVVMYESSKYVKGYRKAVTDACRVAHQPEELLAGPVLLSAVFCFPRPKKHYVGGVPGRDRLRPGVPWYHSSTPDASKLVRALEDGITDSGRFWRDDSQTQLGSVSKVWVHPGQEATVAWVMGLVDGEHAVMRGVTCATFEGRAAIGG